MKLRSALFIFIIPTSVFLCSLSQSLPSLHLPSAQAPTFPKPLCYWLQRGLRCRDFALLSLCVSSFPAQSAVRRACRLSARRYKLLRMSRFNLWYYSTVNGPPCHRASNTPANDCSDSSTVCVCVCVQCPDHLALNHVTATYNALLIQSGLPTQRVPVYSSSSSDTHTCTHFWPSICTSSRPCTVLTFGLWLDFGPLLPLKNYRDSDLKKKKTRRHLMAFS